MTQGITQDTTEILLVAVPATDGEMAYDSSHRVVYYNGSRVVVLTDIIEDNTFTMQGTVRTMIGSTRWYIETNVTIESIRVAVGTAPTGAAIICDVNKNGTTVYTTQSNRPTVAASGFTQLATAPDVTTAVAGDYFTIDVDQVGSTIAGADLTVTMRVRRT